MALIGLWIFFIVSVAGFIVLLIVQMNGVEETQVMRYRPSRHEPDYGLSKLQIEWKLFQMRRRSSKR